MHVHTYICWVYYADWLTAPRFRLFQWSVCATSSFPTGQPVSSPPWNRMDLHRNERKKFNMIVGLLKHGFKLRPHDDPRKCPNSLVWASLQTICCCFQSVCYLHTELQHKATFSPLTPQLLYISSPYFVTLQYYYVYNNCFFAFINKGPLRATAINIAILQLT